MQLSLRQGILPIAWAVWRTETQEFWLELIGAMAMPLIYFAAFGLGLRDYIAEVEGIPYIVFLAPGLISLAILMEAYKIGGWGLWMDRWHIGMVDEYRVKPIVAADIIIGKMIGGSVIALVKGLLTGLVFVVLSPVAFQWQHIAPYLLYMIPGCVLFTALGAMVGVTFRKPDHIAKSEVIFLTPLLYLGGLFFPISTFPEPVLSYAKLLPTTALFDGGRQALLNGEVEYQYMVVLVVFALVMFVGATVWFQKKLSE